MNAPKRLAECLAEYVEYSKHHSTGTVTGAYRAEPATCDKLSTQPTLSRHWTVREGYEP